MGTLRAFCALAVLFVAAQLKPTVAGPDCTTEAFENLDLSVCYPSVTNMFDWLIEPDDVFDCDPWNILFIHDTSFTVRRSKQRDFAFMETIQSDYVSTFFEVFPPNITNNVMGYMTFATEAFEYIPFDSIPDYDAFLAQALDWINQAFYPDPFWSATGRGWTETNDALQLATTMLDEQSNNSDTSPNRTLIVLMSDGHPENAARTDELAETIVVANQLRMKHDVHIHCLVMRFDEEKAQVFWLNEEVCDSKELMTLVSNVKPARLTDNLKFWGARQAMCLNTTQPTSAPTITFRPTTTPSVAPSAQPTITFRPTTTPSIAPSAQPTITFQPTTTPSVTPSTSPTITFQPTTVPTTTPTITFQPTTTPSVTPSAQPTITFQPTSNPTITPAPTFAPTSSPTCSNTVIAPVNFAAPDAVEIRNNLCLESDPMGEEGIVWQGVMENFPELEFRINCNLDLTSSNYDRVKNITNRPGDPSKGVTSSRLFFIESARGVNLNFNVSLFNLTSMEPATGIDMNLIIYDIDSGTNAVEIVEVCDFTTQVFDKTAGMPVSEVSQNISCSDDDPRVGCKTMTSIVEKVTNPTESVLLLPDVTPLQRGVSAEFQYESTDSVQVNFDISSPDGFGRNSKRAFIFSLSVEFICEEVERLL